MPNAQDDRSARSPRSKTTRDPRRRFRLGTPAGAAACTAWSVVDGQGDIWTIATQIENVSSSEMKKRSKAFAKQMKAEARR